MLRTMTLLDPLISRCPCSSAPHTPMMVLFEPIRTLPAASAPWTMTTAGSVPPTAEVKAARVVTVVGLALPPPVVPPDMAAHPTSGLAAGGVQAPDEPPLPAPVAPPAPPDAERPPPPPL